MPCRKPLFEGQGLAVTLLKLVMSSFSCARWKSKKSRHLTGVLGYVTCHTPNLAPGPGTGAGYGVSSKKQGNDAKQIESRQIE